MGRRVRHAEHVTHVEYFEHDFDRDGENLAVDAEGDELAVDLCFVHVLHPLEFGVAQIGAAAGEIECEAAWPGLRG